MDVLEKHRARCPAIALPQLDTVDAVDRKEQRPVHVHKFGKVGTVSVREVLHADLTLTGAARYALPQTFTVFGQKFVPDSWAFSQTVFSSILWVENGETNKVQRRVPGGLDVAFSVLGNDQLVPELVAMMKGQFDNRDRPHAQEFRDGLPYQHNLAAVRAVMDQHTPGAWDSNIYMSWLACLRELSAPTAGAKYPETMRTRAWAMKTFNTQLASCKLPFLLAPLVEPFAWRDRVGRADRCHRLVRSFIGAHVAGHGRRQAVRALTPSS